MRIVAVLGDYYHDPILFKHTMDNILKTLQEINQTNKITIDYVNREHLTDYLTTETDLVILASENRLNPDADDVKTWMTEQISEKIADYVLDGGAWLAWHSGLASYDNYPIYLNLLKGSFDYHPEEHKEVTYTVIDQEITPLKDRSFSFEDEHYFVTCYTDETNVFMKSTSDVGNSLAGWYHNFGKGKVLCFVPAHNKVGLTHASTTQLLIQSIEWLIQK